MKKKYLRHNLLWNRETLQIILKIDIDRNNKLRLNNPEKHLVINQFEYEVW